MNKAAKSKKSGHRSLPHDLPAILPGLVLVLYVIIPTFTPNLKSFDTNAPKFLALALINLVGFITLLTQKNISRRPPVLESFFRTWVGIAYTCFLAASLLSFTHAIDIVESVLQFSKIFTVFSATFIVSTILIKDLRYLKLLILLFTLLLIFDSISVFYYIAEFINGKINSIVDIKANYSNKNILASALFVKLPFALWLLMFGNPRLKWLGWIGLLTGITAVFFMATRAFYLGLIILSSLFLIYLIVKWIRERQKTVIWSGTSYLLALCIAYLAFTGTQEFLYPRKTRTDRLAQGIGEQLATIGSFDASVKARLRSWHWSWQMIKDKPMTGVGTGNWKIVELKYENKTNPDFTYTYKAHNDFIEITAETGIIGGLLYLGIFVLVAWAFLHQLFMGKSTPDHLSQFLFLLGSGIAFYSVDAFFNFPADRPEIQVLFVIFVGSGIAVIHHLKKTSPAPSQENAPVKRRKGVIWLPLVAGFLGILGSIYILYLNFVSSKLQRIVYMEIKKADLTTSSDEILAGFPWIPDQNSLCEPIASLKARYLVDEGKNQEAIDLLRNTHSSPWDGRREFLIAIAFRNLGQTDSTLHYAQKAIAVKPNFYEFIKLASGVLDDQGRIQEITAYHETYLAANKNNSLAWTNAANAYYKLGEVDKAWEVIREARNHLPNDSLVERQYNTLYNRKFIDPYKELFNMGVDHFTKENYATALNYFNQFLEKAPDYLNARELRAYCYFFLEEYRRCIEEINFTETLTENAALINVRGICYRNLDDMDAACKDFEKAMNLGNTEGKSNFEKLCRDRQP